MSDITRLIAEANQRLNAPKAEDTTSDIELQCSHMVEIAKAVVGLGEEMQESSKIQTGAIDELTTAQVIEIQSGLRAIVRTMDNIAKGQAKTAEAAAKTHTQTIDSAVGKIVTALERPEKTVVIDQRGTVKFDIHRDRNGYMESVTATPV